MTILFFVVPWISDDQIHDFSTKGLTYLSRIATTLKASGHEIVIVGNGVIEKKVIDERLFTFDAKIYTVNESSLKKQYADHTAFQAALASTDPAEIGYLKKSLFPLLENEPDIILGWDSPLEAITAIFPHSVVINVSEGMFQTGPMPSLLSFKVVGEKAPCKEKDLSEGGEVSPEDIAFSEKVKCQFLDTLLPELTPFTREELDPYRQFSALYLLTTEEIPLWSNIDHCHDFLIEILQKAPKNIGIVVCDERMLPVQNVDSKAYFYLKEKYPNLIYQSRFKQVRSVDQFLLPLVDGVIASTSTIALQAVFAGKALCVPQHSPYECLATTNDISKIDDVKPRLTEKERIHYFAFLLSQVQFAEEHIFVKDWLSECLQKAVVMRREGQNIVQNAFLTCDGSYRNLFFQNVSQGGYVDIEQTLTLFDRLKQPELRRKITRFNFEDQLIADDRNEVISFGIFDVLIERRIQQQKDIFRLMSPSVHRLTKGRIVFFDVLREYVETCVRLEAQHVGWKAINLEAIYQFFVKHRLLTVEEAETVSALEIATEKQVMTVRSVGLRLFKKAIALNKRVVLISDTVHQLKTIKEMLSELGIQGYDAIYLAHMMNVEKKDGGLFKTVLALEEIAPRDLLHIGHDYHADLIAAEKKGARVHYIKPAIGRLYETEAFGSLYRLSRYEGSLWDAIYLGMVASRFYSDLKYPINRDTHFNGHHYQLGYVGLGPILAAFAIWLARTAKKANIDHLFFLSREGYILKQGFDILAPSIANHIYSAYLYGSRTALLRANITTLEDICRIALVGLSQPCRLDTYLWDRFHVSFNDIPQDILADFQQLKADTIVVHRDLKLYLPFLTRLKEIIYTASAELAKRYKGYLKQIGFIDCSTKAVIDIGYGGSMQESLIDLTENTAIPGYYLLASHKSDHLKMRNIKVEGFLGSSMEGYSMNEMLSNIVFFETLMSTCEGSLHGIVEKPSGKFEPLLDNVEVDLRRVDVLSSVHGGAIAFCRDLVDLYGENLDDIVFDPSSTIRVLTDCISFPDPSDGQLMAGITFDNRFRSGGVRYIVPPKPPGEFEDDKFQEAVDSSVWKTGTMAYWKNEKIQRTLTNPLIEAQQQKIKTFEAEQKQFEEKEREYEKQYAQLQATFEKQKALLQERSERLVEADRQLGARNDYEQLKEKLHQSEVILKKHQEELNKQQAILKERTDRLVIADRELANREDYYQLKAELRKKEVFFKRKEEELIKTREKLSERSSALKEKIQTLKEKNQIIASARKEIRAYEKRTLRGLLKRVTKRRWKEKATGNK